jgi:CheY-like chemotaxis protein
MFSLFSFSSNSIKFTPPGGTIIVRVMCKLDGDEEGDDDGENKDTSISSTADAEEEENDAVPALPAPSASPIAAQTAAIAAPSNPKGTNAEAKEDLLFSPHVTEANRLLADRPPPPTPATGAVEHAAPTGSPSTNVPGAASAASALPAGSPPTGVSAPGAPSPAGTPAAAGGLLSPGLSLAAMRWKPPQHVRMRVSVKDSGRGLSAAELQQMFKPYVQLQSGEQQQGKGTGLGLNISKSLVELHNGVIGVSSAGVVGQGCEFYFEVPFEVVPASESRTRNSPPQRAPGSSSSRSTSFRQQRGSQNNMQMQQHHGGGRGASVSVSRANSIDPTQGLRMWHSPRSVGRPLVAQQGSQQGSPSVQSRRFGGIPAAGSGGGITSAAAEMASRRLAAHIGSESDGQWPDLFHSSPVAGGGGGAGAGPGVSFGSPSALTTPNTHLRTLGFPRRLSASGVDAHANRMLQLQQASMASMQPHESVEQTSLVPIVPTGADTNASLQYMSQLSFLNELAIQGHVSSTSAAGQIPAGATPATMMAGQGLSRDAAGSRSTGVRSRNASGTTSLRTSPLQKYRAQVLLSSGNVPYGAGYAEQGGAQTVLLASSSSQDSLFSINSVDSEEFVPPPRTSGTPQPPSTPASSPLMQVGTLQGSQAASAAGGSSGASAGVGEGAMSMPPSIEQGTQPGEFSTSPFQPAHRRQFSSHKEPVNVTTTAQLAAAAAAAVGSGASASSASIASSSPAVAVSPASAPPSVASAAAGASSGVAAATVAIAAVSDASKARPKVLVVEDSVPNRKLLIMLLRALKCDAVGAEDGLQAIAAFDPEAGASLAALQARLAQGSASSSAPPPEGAGSEFALVLIDGNMPVLDGVAATKALRALGWSTPIVAVTGKSANKCKLHAHTGSRDSFQSAAYPVLFCVIWFFSACMFFSSSQRSR